MKNFVLIILIYIITNTLLQGQNIDTVDTSIETDINFFIEESLEDTEDSQLNEVIEDLIQNPIEINSANIEELLRIPFINPALAKEIIDFRKKYGLYYTIGELNSVPGMTPELFQKIKQLVTIDRSRFSQFNEEINEWVEIKPSSSLSRINIQSRQRIIQNFQEKKGFTTGTYYNSPLKFYNRILADYSKKIILSIVNEKDPGEKSLTDFYSASLYVRDMSVIKNFVIGDYVLEFGQGLSMWRQIGFAKGTEAVYPIMKKPDGVIQYKSTDENQFFRGIAGTINFKSFEIIPFFSSKTFDARIDSTTQLITSTPLDGYHRNESEISRKNASLERISGTRIIYKMESNSIGFTYYKSRFKHKISPNTYFENYDDDFSYVATDFNFFLSSINFFGELSKDKNNRVASVLGLLTSAGKNLNIITVFRNYPARYINIHGYGFGERNGTTYNETGFYLGLSYGSKFGKFNLYFDQFKFPYPLTYDKTTTDGTEILFAYESPLINRTKYIFKYKNELKGTNTTSKDEFGRDKKFTNVRQQQNIRFEVQKFFKNDTRLAFRIEYVRTDYQIIKSDENGLLIFGDFTTRPLKNLTFKTRFTYFQTNSYDSRVYQLESDVPGIFYSTALYGRGIRWYSMIRYKFFKKFELALKYAEFFRDDVKRLGSGHNEIPTNLQNTLTLQIETKL